MEVTHRQNVFLFSGRDPRIYQEFREIQGISKL